MTKTNKMSCAPNEDSDQPGHPPSLISLGCEFFLWVPTNSGYLQALLLVEHYNIRKMIIMNFENRMVQAD